MTGYATILVLVCVAVVFAALNLIVELKRDLMMLQQNSYRPERYVRWLNESGDTTSAWRLLFVIIFFVGLVRFNLQAGAIILALLACMLNALRLLRKKYKKPLVATRRVWRITAVAAIIGLGAVAGAVLLFGNFELYTSFYAVMEALLLIYCCSHIVILISVWMLTPVEKSINNKFIRRAGRILASMPDLKIVGITGSYGKTSTKHFLHRILSEHYDTLMTPGSYNTTMGVVRTINEYLKPYNEVFIVEMGAKSPGDIKEICDLVHPYAGIVTAVGPQHLESFKTIDNVQRTKFELVDSLPSDGLAVVNNDFEKIADREVGNVKCVRYAVSRHEGADVVAEDVKYTSEGTEFTVVDRRTVPGESGRTPSGPYHCAPRPMFPDLRLRTRLLGECNVSDLLGAVVVARNLGVPDDKIQYAVSQIEPVLHRLSITRGAGGVTVLDDAFNSNPVGSAMALDVLRDMKGGRRILVTPGMIELGDREYGLNEEFGRKAASCADIVIVVGVYNREPICEGLKKGGMDFENRVYVVDSFNDARAVLGDILRQGDTVLYENDLPDTFK